MTRRNASELLTKYDLVHISIKEFWLIAKYDISRGTVCIMKSVIHLGKSNCDWYIGDAKSTYVIDQ